MGIDAIRGERWAGLGVEGDRGHGMKERRQISGGCSGLGVLDCVWIFLSLKGVWSLLLLIKSPFVAGTTAVFYVQKFH